MRTLFLACSLLLLAGPAQAQLSAGNTGSAYQTGGVGDDAAAKPEDQGRYVPNDRDGLTGRGGGTTTSRTYSATIGTPMGSTMGRPMGSTMPISQPH